MLETSEALPVPPSEVPETHDKPGESSGVITVGRTGVELTEKPLEIEELQTYRRTPRRNTYH